MYTRMNMKPLIKPRLYRELGARAGCLRPRTIHNFRAEGLYLVSSSSKDEVQVDTRNKRIYCDSYMPKNAETDLQLFRRRYASVG